MSDVYKNMLVLKDQHIYNIIQIKQCTNFEGEYIRV